VVEDALEALPKGLNDTYVRILERIEGQPPYLRELALNCLAWIIYARRPLKTRELQHALAANANCKTQQDLQLDPLAVILEACGNMLEEANGVIRPIHYTVQEFLKTTVQGQAHSTVRTQLQDSSSMHNRLSIACLAYIHLSAFDRPSKAHYDLYDRLASSPFAYYACHSFDYHISECHSIVPDTIKQLEKLFQQDSQYLAAVLQIKVLREGIQYSSIERNFDLMEFLVSASTVVYSTNLYRINAIRQRWLVHVPPRYALHLASSAGLTSAVVRLLEAGCDVYERDGNGGTPLYLACHENHMDIIHLLLKAKAEVNAQGGIYGNALQAASVRGHEAVVRLLLDKDADVNAQGGTYGNELQAASAGGHEAVVRLLLDKDADVNAQGGTYGNALQAASAGGHEAVIRLLLDEGADVNAQGGTYGNALQAASDSGHETVVRLLLDEGADVNAQGGTYGNALQAASDSGHETVVRLLLDEGADVNAQGGYYGNALQAASAEGHEAVVMLLLDKDADVNAQGGYYGNALQAASAEGHEAVVMLLASKGAIS
jgi:ankyrin repeat protein